MRCKILFSYFIFLPLHYHYDFTESFKFNSSEELERVEAERLRLEKERREMQEQEQYFFDYEGVREMYEFDRRHTSEIKSSGVFRQGLHWQPLEILKLENDNILKERERLEKEGFQVMKIDNTSTLS